MAAKKNKTNHKDPMDYGMYPLFDCDQETSVRIHKDFIVEKGKTGFCDACQRLVKEGVDENRDFRGQKCGKTW